jgi:glycosyltransferase involved in cell wall biosynthesis/GT2 family glycosyltransferase
MVAAESEQESKGAPAKRRALFVSHETTLSGAPIQLAHLVAWLKTHGWDPSIAAAEDGPVADKFRAHGIGLFIEPELLIDPDYTVLRNLVPHFDVVVANTIATWQAVQAAHLENVPVVWYLHETLVGVRLMEAIEILRPSLALADALVSPTRATAEIYQPFTERSIHVVPYGIPETNPRAPVPGRPFTFVTIGTYEPRKGQDVLLEAIRRLDPNLRWRALFQMAGRPLEKPFYQQLRAKSESIYNLQLFGPLDHERSLELLNQAFVAVCPSRDGTMPIVLLEAMSLGKAVICTDVGGVREWLRDGLNALLVSSEDPAALSAAIARCICDRDLVHALGVAAKQTFADHFTLNRYGEQFAAILKQTIEPARKTGASGSYSEWVDLYETLGPADRLGLRNQLEALPALPLISILLPVYNPDLRLLTATIDSAKRQIYDRWELCIADDASTDPRVRPFLKKNAASEARIKLIFRENSGHIAACSNSALSVATGEWCALLDQDDVIAEHALAQIVFEIEKDPDVGLIYSDEDKIDLEGVRSNPFFKTDWNPELFLGQNCINHLGTYRTSMLRAIGGFREELEGSQEYDLALRCIERLQPDEVRHIPRILYHCRIVPGSLAGERDAKPDAKEAVPRAIADHLQRIGIAGRAEPCPENIESHRVVYDIPNPAPRAAIIVAVQDSVQRLRECLESIWRLTEYPAYEIVVAASASLEEETVLYLNALEETGVVVHWADQVRNPGRLNNMAGTAANPEIVIFLHSDIEVTDGDWLREMVSHASRAEVGAVGARLWYPDGTLEHGGFVLGLGGIAGVAHHGVPRGHPGFFNRTFLQRNCSAVSSACMAVRAVLFHELGGFDEKNLTSNFQDVDFCLRLKDRGLQVVWTPYADFVHHKPTVMEKDQNSEEKAIFRHDADYMQERWAEELREDPFYSPNLSLAEPGFELAFPPRWFSSES